MFSKIDYTTKAKREREKRRKQHYNKSIQRTYTFNGNTSPCDLKVANEQPNAKNIKL